MTETKNLNDARWQGQKFTPREMMHVTRTEIEDGGYEIQAVAQNGALCVHLSVWPNYEGARLHLMNNGETKLVLDLNWDEMDVLSLAIQGTHHTVWK